MLIGVMMNGVVYMFVVLLYLGIRFIGCDGFLNFDVRVNGFFRRLIIDMFFVVVVIVVFRLVVVLFEKVFCIL